ncbi:hypothetical protein K8S19_04545, partial [bacterium]|nr:hypothetical protein [bacterium]
RELSRRENKLGSLDTQAALLSSKVLTDTITQGLQAKPATRHLSAKVKALSERQIELEKDLTRGIARVQSGVKAWQAAGQMEALQKGADAFRDHLKNQSTAMADSLRTQQTIQAFNRMGLVEQQVKQSIATAVFSSRPEKLLKNAGTLPQADAKSEATLRSLLTLSQVRRDLVTGMQHKAAAQVEILKQFDVTRFAAEAETFLVASQTDAQGLWDLADLQNSGMVQAGQAVAMLGKLHALKNVEQTARDALVQKSSRTVALSHLRQAVNQLTVLEKQTKRVRESKILLAQFEQGRERMSGLQAKAKSYQKTVQEIGKTLQAIPTTGESAAARQAADSLNPAWQTLQQQATHAVQGFAEEKW